MTAKFVKLKDKTKVQIRPMKSDDLEMSLAFFRELPEEDRAYLRRDVTRREIVEERIREMDAHKVRRLVAVVDNKLLADGALELPGGWSEHAAEVRLIVGRSYQRKGLGVLMARELYRLAASERVEQIVVRMMKPQVGARKMFERLGFHEDAVLPAYVRDRGGRKQDLVLMRCNLEGAWEKMERFLAHSDWQRAR